MKKKDTAEKVKDESCLKVSDWVTFLSNEKHGTINTMVNFGMLLVALIGILFSTTANTTMQGIGYGIFAFALVTYMWLLMFRPFRQRSRLAETILNEIISGELKDTDSIRKEWMLGLTVIRQGWFRQGKARLAALKRSWHRGRVRLTILGQIWRYRWEAELAALKQTWQHEWEARLPALKRVWWHGTSSNR